MHFWFLHFWYCLPSKRFSKLFSVNIILFKMSLFSQVNDTHSSSQPYFYIFSKWHWMTHRNTKQIFRKVLLEHNMASEQNLDSLDEPGFEQLRGLLHSCVSWGETNILRGSKRLHTHQELWSNPANSSLENSRVVLVFGSLYIETFHRKNPCKRLRCSFHHFLRTWSRCQGCWTLACFGSYDSSSSEMGKILNMGDWQDISKTTTDIS